MRRLSYKQASIWLNSMTGSPSGGIIKAALIAVMRKLAVSANTLLRERRGW